MSYDRQIDQLCPHIVVDEGLFVSPVDRQTVVPMQPIAAVDSVVVRYNSELTIPSFGVELAASVVGSKSGPFDVVTGVNDTMVLSVNQGPNVTLTVPASKQIQPNHLAAILNQQLSGAAFTSTGTNVGITTAKSGPGASIFVRSTSTLAVTLGITTNREYRGIQVAPGWSLVGNSTASVANPARMIVFDEPLKGFNDYVEISYNTQQRNCRRCGGLGVENDWRYGNSGEVARVTDEALLVQEIQKIFYTRRGSNPFHTWYGTLILDQIGQRLSAGGIVQNTILTECYTAFTRWQSIKRQQEQNVGQVLSDEEYPYRLVSVTLNQSTQDPTVVFVNSVIQNRSTKPIQIFRGLKLPQPLDLLGSTAQQGQIRQSLSNFVLTG